jgi:hypothetical protein
MKKHLTAINIPDCHRPFHDEKAWKIVLASIKLVDRIYGVDEINIMGDFADAYWCSLHEEGPEAFEVNMTFEDEIKSVRQGLEELRRAAPKARIRYIEGNHEYRLPRYFAKKAPKMYGAITLPKQLELHNLSIEWIPYGKFQKVSCLGSDYQLRHEPYSNSKNCATVTAHSKAESLGFGHTHRQQTYKFKKGDGTYVQCRSLGWLGDVTSPVFSYAKTDDWSQGFEIAHYYPESKTLQLDYINIENHMAVVYGKLIGFSDSTDRTKRMQP